MTKDGPQPIGDILKDLAKRYSIDIGAASDVIKPVQALTTGNLAIDHLTGVGGLPLGRIVELYGQPSSGKTTTALQAAAELQKQIIASRSSDRILYLDYEKALDGEYCAALGLDVDHPSFLLAQPTWLEDGADIAERLIKTGVVRLSIWDSVAKMTPKELEFGVRTQAMERARLMKALLERQVAILHEYNCAGVFLNHLTEAVQMTGGRPGMPPAETSPGGKALKYYASLRMAYKQIGNIKGKTTDALVDEVTEQVIATNVKVKVTKNKIGNPFREAVVRVRFGVGFDNTWSALQVLVAHKKVVAGPSGMFYFDPSKVEHLVTEDMDVSGTGRPYLKGENNLLLYAEHNPDWKARFVATATAVIAEHGAPVVAEDVDDLSDVFTALPAPR